MIDAYRTDLLTADERGPGTAVNVTGYRIAMIVSGGIALMIAQWFGWRETYFFLALCLLPGVVASMIAQEPHYNHPSPTSLRAAVVEPFKQFLTQKKAIWFLIFIVIYKLSYAFILIMTPTFLLRALHFSLVEVGAVNKGVGVVATLFGIFIGGIVCTKIGAYRSLFIFALLQASSNLLFVLLAHVGKDYSLMMLTIFSVNLFAGMEASVFVVLLMSVCDKRYTATQYALLSALATAGNAIISPISGLIVQSFGWICFFWLSFLVIIPALFLLIYLKDSFVANGAEQEGGVDAELLS